MPPTRLALIGLGKIARDQHLPAIAGNDSFTLAATVDPKAPGIPGVAHLDTVAALRADGPEIDAAILCTPPQQRYGLAADCLARGLHVLLEKPPAATLGEVESLRAIAARSGATLFAAWHSRFAPFVEPARAWLAERSIRKVAVTWHEDVRVWHPGQRWIWEPGGLGVFDPGINALSILTMILPHAMHVDLAKLTYPANRAAPIAASLSLRDYVGRPISVDLDWRPTGAARWDIEAETDAGFLRLTSGGAALFLPSGTHSQEPREYSDLYQYFATLIQNRTSDLDIVPMRLVADAYLRGSRETVEPFHD